MGLQEEPSSFLWLSLASVRGSRSPLLPCCPGGVRGQAVPFARSPASGSPRPISGHLAHCQAVFPLSSSQGIYNVFHGVCHDHTTEIWVVFC